MKTSILALFLSQLVSLSEQSPVTTDLAVTRAPTQSGALSNCSSWYIATPGDDCNTLLSMIGVTDVARDSGNLYSLNPQIHDCWHDVWAGYRYCLKMPATTTSQVAASTTSKPPSVSTTSQVAASTSSKPPSSSTTSQVAASSSSTKSLPSTTVIVVVTVPTLTVVVTAPTVIATAQTSVQRTTTTTTLPPTPTTTYLTTSTSIVWNSYHPMD